tara:strand:- start:1215 stop:1379 length:165 start_codon:yes stop_codon:yes gene_type:complete
MGSLLEQIKGGRTSKPKSRKASGSKSRYMSKMSKPGKKGIKSPPRKPGGGKGKP